MPVETEFEYTGAWWDPGEPDKRLSGTLRHTPEKGATLEVMGSFHAQADGEDSPLPVIHGATREAPYVSLHGCSEHSLSEDFRGLYATGYDIDTAVLGEHIAPGQPVAFGHLTVRFSSLVRWAFLPVVDLSDLHKPGPTKKITLFGRKEFDLGQHRECSMKLMYGRTWESTAGGLTLSVKPDAHVSFEFARPRDFELCAKLIGVFRDFLTFATGMPTAVLQISAPRVRDARIGGLYEHRVYSHAFRGPVRTVEYAPSLFELKDVEPNIRAVVSAWFGAAEKLQPVFDQYLAGCYLPEMQPESRFLATARAVEAYHRRTRKNRQLPEDEHEARMTVVLAGVPRHHRQWLEGALRYSNEPGFRMRLKTLYDENRDILSHFTIDRKSFSNAACDTRNYLTHYDQSLEKKARQGTDLWMLIHSLQLLLDVCLLRDLRVPDEAIIALAKKKHMLLIKST